MLKNFFNKKEKSIQNLFEKKSLMHNIYPKYYARKILKKESKIIQVLDKDSTLVNLKQKTQNSTIKGLSYSLDIKKYTNTLDTNFSLSYLKNFDSTISINTIKKFYSLLFRLKQNKTINSNFLVRKPVKGGFEGVSHGIKGFLPKYQGKLFLKNKINSSFLLSNSKNPIKKLKLLKKSSSFSYNLIISRLKGQLNLSNNFTFFKNQKAFLRNNFSNFIFTNPNFKKYFYAHKKRLKNKTFKSKNKKIR